MSRQQLARTSVFGLFVLVLFGCAQPPTVEDGPGANVVTIDGVRLGGQPSEEALRRAAAAGVETVINLRLFSELDYDEAALAAELGLDYHNPGFRGANQLTDAVLDHVLALLRDTRGPIYVHCSSGNRVGAVWAAHRVVHDGIDVEAAFEEGRRIGLRVPAYEARVREFLRDR